METDQNQSPNHLENNNNGNGSDTGVSQVASDSNTDFPYVF